MKFARYLDENTVPEWKRVYIQYRGLKKLIKRVAQHREARLHLQNEAGPSYSKDTFGRTTDSALRQRKRSEGREETAATSGAQQQVSVAVPPVSLDGTGLQLSSTHSERAAGSEHTSSHDLDLEHFTGTDQNPKQSSDAEQPTSIEHDQPPELPPAQPASVHYPNDRHHPDRPPRPAKRSNSSGASSRRGLLVHTGSLGHISLRSTRSELPSTLEELISACFDEEEAKFFSVCDNELERVIDFYEERESEAVHKYELLARQLEELAEHRREYRAKYGARCSDQTVMGGARDRLAHIFSTMPTHVEDLSKSLGKDSSRGDAKANTASEGKGKQEQSEDRGDKRRAEALAHMQSSLQDCNDESDAAVRAANKAAAMSHDPEAYAAARKKLKATVLEYYRFLETLNNYKILNRTGFAKVMKKFSKTVDVPCTDLYYKARVAPSVLVTSERIPKLLKATEDIYAAYFEHGNRKQAINRLRVREDHTSHHFSVFRTGTYLGVALCATVAGLIQVMHPETQRRIPQWQAILRVYGAMFIPTLFALLFGLNLTWWHHVRINTVFIFEWDVRHTMDHRQFFEIPALLMLLLSVFFWVSFVNPFPTEIAPTTWPAVWLVVVALVMLNPLPILFRESRSWLVVSMVRVLTAGYKRVEFRDFFLGDELNSVAWSLSNFWFIGCEWRHKWAHPDQCAPNSTYWTAVLLSVPAVLRLGQCLRRWNDSDYRTYLHLVNAGKYSSAILNNFFYIHYRRNGSHRGGDLALWLVFACIYSIWHVAWDLVMDWSLLRPRAKYFLLRNELSFPVPVYYLFIAVDIVGRCNWIVYLFPGKATITLRSFLAALVEMLRRVCWNNLRVENEQIGNTDSFKVIRDLPLPYRQRLRDGFVSDDADEMKTTQRKGFLDSIKMSSFTRRKGRTDADGSDNERTKQSRATPTVPDQDGPGKATLKERVRDRLVPDAKGPAYGNKLDQRGASKGESGRDYAPRAGELDGSDNGDSDDGSTTGGDERLVAS